MFAAGKVGDAYLAAAEFHRERLAVARTDNGLTIELRREVERVLTSIVLGYEEKARASYRAAGLDLDGRLMKYGVGEDGNLKVCLVPEEAAA
jgi:hypothetical protein